MNHEEFLKQFGSVTDKLAEQSKRVDKSWWGISKSVEGIGSTLEQGWPAAIAKLTGQQTKLIHGFSKWSEFIKNPEVYNDWVKRAKDAQAKVAALQAIKWGAGSLTADQVKELAAEEEIYKSLNEQIDAHKIIGELELRRLVLLPAILGSVKATAGWVEKQQEALKDSNTTLNERIRLMRDIASTQRATGASAETLAEATQSAVRYGLDLRDTYGQDLTLITKMKEGMGVAAEDSAAMVASMRLMGQNADRVADAIARIKTDTGLAAAEATKLAKELTIAMATMAPGGSVDKVLEVVGRLEGAAQGLGLGSGNVMKFLSGLQKQSGLMGAGMLGMQPDVLKDNVTAMEAFSRMVEFTEKQLQAAGDNAYMRQAVLEQYAEVFGTTTEIIASGSKILADYNKQKKTATTLDEQWRQQTDTFSKSWDKLKNQLAGITHYVLIPLVAGAQKVVEALSFVVEWFAETATAAWAAGIALSGAGLHSIYRLFTGLKGSPTFINAFVKFLPMLKGASGWLGALTPKLAGIGAAGSALSALIGVLGIGAAGAAGYGIGKLIGSVTGLDKAIQKWTGGGVQSGIQRGAGLVAPKGMIGQRDWMSHIENMRAAGIGEADVHKWGMANINKIKEFQGQDPDKLGWTSKQKKILQSRYFGEGYERQRMLETQATTLNADLVVEETTKQTQILARLEALGEMQVELARQGRIGVQETNAQMRLMDEAESTNAIFKRIEVQTPTIRRCH